VKALLGGAGLLVALLLLALIAVALRRAPPGPRDSCACACGTPGGSAARGRPSRASHGTRCARAPATLGPSWSRGLLELRTRARGSTAGGRGARWR